MIDNILNAWSRLPIVRIAKEPTKESFTRCYQNTTAPLLRYAGVVIDCYADDYASASELAYLVESGLRSLTSENIKHVSITAGPSRMGEESGQEHRAISAEVVVQAYDLN